MYAGEEDLLEIRLNMLKDVVDLHLIIEGAISHSNKPKPLYFLDNHKRFDSFSNKIIYRTAKFQYENAFYNDWAYRDIMLSSISNLKNDDIICHSDIDEIPCPETLKEVCSNIKQPVTLEGQYYQFCVDLLGRRDKNVIVIKAGWIKDSLHKYRDNRSNYHVKDMFTFVNNASWHYSSLAPIENIISKFERYAHHNEVAPQARNKDFLLKCIKEKNGHYTLDEPPERLKLVEHNEQNIPVYILKNKKKYEHLFYEYYKNL